MALTNAYLQTTKNLHSIINSVISAKAPERFTNKFLEDLGFKSSNDNLYQTYSYYPQLQSKCYQCR